jgi:hypothetical protein
LLELSAGQFFYQVLRHPIHRCDIGRLISVSEKKTIQSLLFQPISSGVARHRVFTKIHIFVFRNSSAASP